MLTDEVKIKVTAGKGGDGVVAFNKIKMMLGPTGGRGGNGGNVYFVGVSDLTALNRYRHKKDFYAEDGEKGHTDNSSGHNGEDLFLNVPVGSVLRDPEGGENDIDIVSVGQEVLVVRGGLGGRGNFYFRSPVNTSPEERELGKAGEEKEFLIELRLIADVGLIGLPNAGKSSLLNELTKANAKVANYSFTTLEPNLGALEKIIIADIPGLIEGASLGKGLGIKFLKHVQRTKTLIHCISSESDNIERDYDIIKKELGDYNPELNEKQEMLLLTKTDLLNEKELKEKKKEIEKLAKKKKIINTDMISIHDWDGVEKLKNIILNLK
jgi:GTP-binding protein